MYIAELDLRFELKDEELVEVDECEYEIHSDTLRRELEELLCSPILRARLFLDSLPDLAVQIEPDTPDLEIVDGWLFFSIIDAQHNI